MKQILHLLIYLLIGSFVFPHDCEDCVCEEPVDVWYRLSTNESHMYGEIMAVDMSMGYAYYDEFYIYLFVLEKNTKEELVIMFPIGFWEVGVIEPTKELPKEEEEKEFDLDEYLKQNKGKGVKIARQY
tara:strand:+ start:141 stop:524 length:384 start_codon:yes stop_codon:yes gene_type:complete